MTLNDTDLDSDLVEIVADYPQSFGFGGTAYACVADDLTMGHRPAEAGIFDEDSLVIHVRTAILPDTRPAAGDTIVYPGITGSTYRVKTAKTGPDDLLLVLTCEEETA